MAAVTTWWWGKLSFYKSFQISRFGGRHQNTNMINICTYTMRLGQSVGFLFYFNKMRNNIEHNWCRHLLGCSFSRNIVCPIFTFFFIVKPTVGDIELSECSFLGSLHVNFTYISEILFMLQWIKEPVQLN